MDNQETPSIRQVLDEAATAIKRGDFHRGKEGLEWVLEREPDNVLAWLWMSRCAESHQAKLKCFHRVLAIDPNNNHALDGMRRFGGGNVSAAEDKGVTASQSKRRGSKKTRKKAWLIGLSIVAVPFLCFFVFALMVGQPTSTNSVKASAADTSSEPTKKPSRLWVVYRLTNSASWTKLGGGMVGGVVSVVWENNTGGSDSGDRLVGDDSPCPGLSDKSLCPSPVAWGYTMRPGDFAYLSAQLDEESTHFGKLMCEIYLTDDDGKDALVFEDRVPGGLEPWKRSICDGDYCICTASGMVG